MHSGSCYAGCAHKAPFHDINTKKPAFHDTDIDTDTDILAISLPTRPTRDILKLFLW